MIHECFYGKSRRYTLVELVNILKKFDPSLESLNLPSDAYKRSFSGISALEKAEPHHVSYFSKSVLGNVQYDDHVATTQAGCVLLPKNYDLFVSPDTFSLRVNDPYALFAHLISFFYDADFGNFYTEDPQDYTPIHKSATVHTSAKIHPTAIIGPHASIGEGTVIHAHAVIGHGVVVGNHCVIEPHATLAYAFLGSHVRIKSGARIGQSGFGFHMSGKGPLDMPQMGIVRIHDHAMIGANTCVDRGTFGETVIGMGCRVDNLVQIAHNVTLGPCCVLAAQVGISGSTTLGAGVMAGGQAGFSGHLTIENGVRIAAQSGVMRSISANTDVAGSPCMPVRDWHKQTIFLKRSTLKKSS